MSTNYKPGYRSVEITKETYNELMKIGGYKQTIDQVIKRCIEAFRDKSRK